MKDTHKYNKHFRVREFKITTLHTFVYLTLGSQMLKDGFILCVVIEVSSATLDRIGFLFEGLK